MKEKSKEEYYHSVTIEQDIELTNLELAKILSDEENEFCTAKNSDFCAALSTMPSIKRKLETASVYRSYPNFDFKGELEKVASELRSMHKKLHLINNGNNKAF